MLTESVTFILSDSTEEDRLREMAMPFYGVSIEVVQRPYFFGLFRESIATITAPTTSDFWSVLKSYEDEMALHRQW